MNKGVGYAIAIIVVVNVCIWAPVAYVMWHFLAKLW